MTYPDSGAPADPRDELEAIRRRLAELSPTGARGPGNGLLVAGGLALAGALAVLLTAIAVASTLDGGAGQAAVLIAALHAQGHGRLDHGALLGLVDELSGRDQAAARSGTTTS